MSFALSAGVSGLEAHQKMLDVAGNNLANVNTTAFKASRITFSELLSETIRKASQPTSTIGGTNPVQMGSGVAVAGITPNMAQGNIVNTGNPLDLAVEGDGYFVMSDGQQNLYTRAGAFAVDANSNLIDPATGYFVQRIGSVGESDGFQVPGSSNIHVPYDVSMAANATSQIDISGNLAADSSLPTAQAQVLTSNIGYTYGGGVTAESTTAFKDIDQFTGGSGVDGKMGAGDAGTIALTGFNHDGTALSGTFNITGDTKLSDVLTWLNTDNGVSGVNEKQTIAITGTPTGGTFQVTYGGQSVDIPYGSTAAAVQSLLEGLSSIGAGNVTCTGGILPDTAVAVEFTGDLAAQDVSLMTIDTSNLTGGTSPSGTITETTQGQATEGALGGTAVASLVDGKIRITDNTSGYSKSDITLAYSGDGELTMPGYFEMTTVGGEEVKNVNITVYDSQGGKHSLSGAFVRTDTPNTWDMILTSVTGNIHEIDMANRRINGLTFNAKDGSYAGLEGLTIPQFQIAFDNNPASPQTIAINLGTVGKLNGITQFAGDSTAVARSQDGYEAGRLSSVSIDNQGMVIGAFSNGIKKDIAALQIGLFQNTSGLESVGNGYFIPSANSGEAVATLARSGGAGTIHGGALEKSNADVATEFVNMIQAQNGFQANARTIKVANEILQELTRLIA